jgi:hypothetical protein
MGKNGKANKHKNKKHVEDDHLEKLQLLAEKLGKNIWEITPEDEENGENSEEEISQSESHSEHEEQEEKAIHEEEIADEVVNDSKPQVEIKLEDTTEGKDKGDDVGNFEIPAIQSDSTYPQRIKYTEEITKVIEKIQIPNEGEKKQKLIAFMDVKTTFLYPKEQVLPNSSKKKKKLDNYVYIPKKKDKLEEAEPEDEELKRLEEVRQKREEFAFLEKLKQEELQKKKELKLEDTVEKKNYKPKGKKKKGK